MTFLDHVLHHLIPATGSAVIAWWVARWPIKPPPIDPALGSLVVRYGWGFRVISLFWFVVLGGPALLFASAFVRDPAVLISPAGVLVSVPVLIFTLAVYLLAEAFRVRIDITPEGIIGTSPWRRQRVIRWDEVVSVSYSHLFNWFVITGPQGQKIRAHEYLHGLPWLAQAVEQNVSPDVYVRAAESIRAYAQKANPKGP
jgi:hypothetical protein